MPSQKTRPNGACPTFFRALCMTASQGGADGGYKWAGFGLAGHISGLTPYEVEDDEWNERVEALEQMLGDDDEDGALAWLDANLPRCMALVPRPRRSAFYRGVYRYAVEDENGLFS